MNNALAIKVYEVDYSFIIKNYLDKNLWNKSWVLFEYKDYVFTINLSSINVKTETIYFEINCNKLKVSWKAGIYNPTETIGHNLKNSNINVLKRQINGAIYSIIHNMELIEITNSEGYEAIESSMYEERSQLREIAESFLDDNGVTNNEIREVYIDHYVDKNETIYQQKDEYKNSQRFNVLTDLYLVFARAIKDEEKEMRILENLNSEKAEKVLQEVNEYMERLETEEYQEELKDALEDI